jgi:hypothetical protein
LVQFVGAPPVTVVLILENGGNAVGIMD